MTVSTTPAVTTNTTPLADLIGHTCELRMRGSEVHVLIGALLGRLSPEEATAAGELMRALIGLRPDLAADTDLVNNYVERAVRHAAGVPIDA